MTEVREDKEKPQSEKENGEAESKLNRDIDIVEDSKEVSVSCDQCGRIFKNERALKTHERHCKKRMETTGKLSDVEILRQELLNEMQAINTERMRLEEEKATFLEELRAERERLKEDLKESLQYAQDSIPLNESPKDDFALDDEMAKLELNLESISSGNKGDIDSSMEMDLDNLAMELENLESEISTKVDFDAMRRMADDFMSTIKTIEDNMTTIQREWGEDKQSDQWDESKLNTLMADEFGKLLGPLEPGAKDEALISKMAEIDSQMNTDTWLYRKGKPAAMRSVKIRSGVEVAHRMHKAPGGLIRADFEVRDGQLSGVSISGDFFCYPKDAITRLESMLEGAPTVETQKVLEKFCSQQDIEIPGVDLQDWIKVLST